MILSDFAKEILPEEFKGKAVLVPMTITELGVVSRILTDARPNDKAAQLVCSYMGEKLFKLVLEATDGHG